MRVAFLILFIVTLSVVEGSFCFSQSVGINALGNLPNQSAGLDVDFNNKGILIPRLTSVQRFAIINPANGLLVFDKDSDCFFFYKTAIANWTSLCSLIGAPGPPGPSGSSGPPSSSNGFKATINSFSTKNVDIPFNIIIFNDGGNYNPVNGKYTCPSSGVYFFSTQANNGSIDFYLNGVAITNLNNYNEEQILKLNAGDYVTLRTNAPFTLTDSYFSGYKVY